MEILKYNGFEGSAELDMQKNVCWGKLLYIDDVVTYKSDSIADLQKQFEEAVDDYIETCKLVGKEPQKPCRGLFNVRVSPELHKAALRRAVVDDTSLNDVVCKALDAYLSSKVAKAPFADIKHVSATGALHVFELKTMASSHQQRCADAFVNSETVAQDFMQQLWIPSGSGTADVLSKIYETSHAH